MKFRLYIFVSLFLLYGCGSPPSKVLQSSPTNPISSTQTSPKPSIQQTVPKSSAIEQKWPYKFLESKTEQTGHRNVMDLYAFSGKFDLAELKAFCQDRKQKSTAKAFYYVVIFDNVSNARFPSSPFTAGYGLEENVAKHIRAIYEYNRLNGFSELTYHDRNIWENIPNREKI